AVRANASLLTCVELSLDPQVQYNESQLTEIELPETFAVEVTLEGVAGEPVSGETALDVTVTNHFGEFGPPSDSLGGSMTASFDDGTGSFTIGEANTDADLELGLLGHL